MVLGGAEIHQNLMRAQKMSRGVLGASKALPSGKVRGLGLAGGVLSGTVGVHRFLTAKDGFSKTSGALDALSGISEGVAFLTGSGFATGFGIALAVGAMYFDRAQSVQVADIHI